MDNPMVRNSNNIKELLFEQFATLATAPDGIARLRELILQLAVQGKLGTNNPIELPLKIDESKRRIRKAKSQNGDSNKIQIIDIFSPDSIPKNWKKTTLGSVGVWSTGGTPSRREVNYFDGDIPWIKSGDLNDGIVTKTDETISQSGLDNSNAKFLPKGTISIALYGATIGKLGILGIEAATNQACANCVINEKIITSRYLFHFLRSQRSHLIQVGQGGAQPNITNWIIWEWPIVIPPLAEQHRIVAKVDRLMALCDELEARQQQERAGCLRLGTASLTALQNAESPEEFEQQWEQVCDAFDLILDCPENVAVLRQTILQIAVQGRLVRQELGDEPARKLLERIRREKLSKFKKENHEESINKMEIPYRIPNEWEWVKLEQICTLITDGTHITPTYIQKGIPFLSVKDVSKGQINFSNTRFISHEEHKEISKRCNPEFEDILFTKVGTTGIAKVIDVKREFSIFVSVALLKFPKHSIFPYYFELVLNSPFVKEQSAKNTQGVGNKNLVLKSIKTFDIPLPPLAEQHRIVEKVDALMALCDTLEALLKERAGVQGRFAGAVVKQVAG
jgi:type I restriction enzyme S subunit